MLQAKAGQAKAASKATAKPKGAPGHLEETMARDMLESLQGPSINMTLPTKWYWYNNPLKMRCPAN